MAISNVSWALANPMGIWTRGIVHPGIEESSANAWNTGRTNDLIDDGTGLSFTVASDNGGVWRVAAGAQGVPVSNGWTKAHFRSLAVGPNSNDGTHLYAGGEGLFETDLSNALPLISWREITSLAKQFPGSGMIYRILVLLGARVIVVACSGGVFFSRIPDPPQSPGCLGSILGMSGKPWADSYKWRKAILDTGVEDGGFHDLAIGLPVSQAPHMDGFANIIVGGLSTGVLEGGFKNIQPGSGPPGLFLGTWKDPDTLVIHQSKITHQRDDLSLLLGDFGNCSVASFEGDRHRAYAVAAFSFEADHNLFGVMRSFDGGASWDFRDATVEDLEHTGKKTPIRDEPKGKGARAQARYNQSIAVSPTDPDTVALGLTRPYISWDAADTWVAPSIDVKETLSAHLHSDVHGIRFASVPGFGPNRLLPGVPQAVYSASDGGVAEVRWGNWPWLLATDSHSDGHHADLVALVLEDNDLAFYFRRSTNLTHWERYSVVTHKATGPGCIIQSDFHSGDGGNRNFEVVVLEGSNLVHYYGAIQGGKLIWTFAGVITSSATGPGCLIQSTFTDGDHGHFEVVVLEGSDLVHYSKNNSNPKNPWGRTGVVTHNAIAPGCIIQSDFPFGQDDPNFEVVVLEQDGLKHYARDNSGSPWPWIGPTLISTQATGPACFIQADYTIDDDNHANFEMVVPEGPRLFHWVRDNQTSGLPWRRDTDPITPAGRKASGPACLIQSNFGGDEIHGNFELLACEGGNVVHYWRDNAKDTFPWVPGVLVTPCAFTYSSQMNRTLATLEFNRPQGGPGTSPGYGSLGLCRILGGLAAGGTQDNGVVFSISGDSPAMPWSRHLEGDGSAAMFLAAVSERGASLRTGTTLVDYSVDLETPADEGAPVSGVWQGGSFTNDGVIPLAGPNPAIVPPPDPTLGLITPLIEPVVAPLDDQPGNIVGAGAAGADAYALVLKAIKEERQIFHFQSGWVFQTSIPSWSTKVQTETRTITALASWNGKTILVGVKAQGTLTDGSTLSDSQIFSVDTSSKGATKMPRAFAGPLSQINDLMAVNPNLAVAVDDIGNVLLTVAGVWQLTPAQPMAGRLVAIATDRNTNPPTLFVASESLVFVSADLGKNWLPASNGLPAAVRCSDLEYLSLGQRQELYLTTYGRSLWVAKKRELWVRP